MFGQITNDETDHWNPMSSNPIIPPLVDDVQEIPDDPDVGDEQQHEGFVGEEINYEEDDEPAPSPSIIIGKKKFQGSKLAKKQRVGTTLVIQEKISNIADSAKAFTKKNLVKFLCPKSWRLLYNVGQCTDQMSITLPLLCL